MVFNSVAYLVFLPLVLGLYFAIPHRWRWIWLLGSSYYFYGSLKWEFLVLLIITTLIDWYCGIRIEDAREKKKKKYWVAVSLVSNLGILFFFKYFNYFLGDTALARKLYEFRYTAHVLELTRFVIPAGISFYTFQSISYVIDVYRGTAKAERSFPRFTLFVSYFPQLVAGPIERYSHLRDQIFSVHFLKYENLSKGFRLMLQGFFLKICIADNLAMHVDRFYASPLQYHWSTAVISCLFFTFQVYADFSGYSLIAQGSARLMGVHLMDNFRQPLWSKSIPEFWNRWHISLSTWFKDYIFIPMGGNRVHAFRFMINIMVVFLISGLWHGANFTMIAFGALQGLFYWADRFVFNRWLNQHSLYDFFGRVKTFLFFTFSLLFFRAYNLNNYTDALHAAGGAGGMHEIPVPIHVWLFLGLLLVYEWFMAKERFDIALDKISWPLRWSLYSVLLVCIWLLGGTVNHPFVYFQF